MKRIILFLLSINIIYSFSQSGNVTDYLPLQVGNVWVYQYNAFGSQPCFQNQRIRVKLIGTIIYNGKTYFQSQISIIAASGYSGCNRGFLPYDSLLRVDSATGKVLRYAPGSGCLTPNELLLDSFKARLNDSILIYCQVSPPGLQSRYICADTNNTTVFGTSRQSRLFSHSEFEASWSRKYAKGIGLISSTCGIAFCQGNSNLLGCVIGGVTYGDTTFPVGVNQISTEVPNSISLYQNYPNPFNPNTKIKFDIPSNVKGEMLNTKLNIYDAVGREVSALLNEKLGPGTYEAEWNAADSPSGVYFYQLTIGNEQLTSYTETKKMVLIK